MNKGLFVLLFPVTLLSWGTLHAQQKRDKRKVVLTNSVIYDEGKWKTSSGIIPALFPIKSPNSERVIEQLHNSELLRNSSINTTFDVAMVIE
jgi:hypothetical protein